MIYFYKWNVIFSLKFIFGKITLNQNQKNILSFFSAETLWNWVKVILSVFESNCLTWKIINELIIDLKINGYYVISRHHIFSNDFYPTDTYAWKAVIHSQQFFLRMHQIFHLTRCLTNENQVDCDNFYF